jgi:outer membrane protein assembly factor BamB
MSTNIECSPSTVGVASTATIAPMIIGGTKTLVDFVGGGDGNFYALNPDNGAFIWEQCFGDGRIFAAVTVAPGIVAVGARRFFRVLDSSSGKQLFAFEDTNKDTFFYGAPTIAHGVIYVGNNDGNLYAFGLFAKRKQQTQ